MSGPVGYHQKKPDTMEGLPKQFVSSLRILFDILDENRTGFVRLKDIESRWSDDGVRGLPAGVVDGLRRVTPHDGLLSFERFVAGLKLVLNMRHNSGNESRKPFASKENTVPHQDYKRNQQSDVFPREPNHNLYGSESHSGYNTSAAARHGSDSRFDPSQNGPSNPLFTKKTDPWHHNDPQTQMYGGRLSESNRNPVGQPVFNRPPREESPVHRETTFSTYAIKPDVRNYPSAMGSHQSPSNQGMLGNSGTRVLPRNIHQPENPPALPPRSSTGHAAVINSFNNNNNVPNQMRKSHSGPELHQSQSPPAVPPRGSRPNSHILSDLKNWQKEWIVNQNTVSDPEYMRKGQGQRPAPSGKYDKNTIYANIEQFQRKSEDLFKQQTAQKVTVRRHGSGRRHTLSSGIDQNMLKRMKQLEEERAILQSGLAMVDTARDWYQKQLSVIGDRQAMLGKVSYNDNSLEAHQERMSFQRARVEEVNQQLRALVESSEKGFPLHMNLAMSSRITAGDNEKTLINRNRKLMEEMNHKTNLISQLEKEKATLVRELFEARSKNKPNHDDTTFM